MRYLISTAVLALCLAATSAYAAPVTTASSVLYEVDMYDVTVTPTGPTVLNLGIGDAYHLEGTWSGLWDPTNNGCVGCVRQIYLAGNVAELNVQFNLANIFSYPTGGPQAPSGSYSGDFFAPLTPGVYYIGAAFTLDFSYQNVTGSTNQNGQASYILNVGQPAPVPEPASVLLLGTGLLGVVRLHRRTRAS